MGSDPKRLMEILESVGEVFRESRAQWLAERERLLKECDDDTKLAVTSWVMENICVHAREGGSYRYLIYERLGFGPEAYVPLLESGGMTISNEFILQGDPE